MPPNTRTLKGQSYSTKRWANLAWPKGSKLSGFSNYKLKYTLRALFIYEQITGKAFELKTITDEYLFFYCVLMANNPDSPLTFEELIEAIDEDMGIMVEFQNFLKKELEKQQLFITNNADAKKKS